MTLSERNKVTIAGLSPAPVWEAFAEIAAIPRPSKQEAAIMTFLEGEARQKKLTVNQDAVGNRLIGLPASPGCGAWPGLTIQAHVDMVCEQNQGGTKDFAREGIELVLNGDWLVAQGTSLGADNGIAVAMMLALLRGSEPHGPIDLLLTIDEETGLNGAQDLDPALLRQPYLINLDSEEEGSLFIGCAGGTETELEVKLAWTPAPSGEAYRLRVSGLRGGHSGADIHLGSANALVLLARILTAETGLSLANLEGGDKHNVIPREAFADLVIPKGEAAAFSQRLAEWKTTLGREFHHTDPSLTIELEPTTVQRVLARSIQTTVLALVRLLPYGVISMSQELPNLVSTSMNVAAVKIAGDSLVVRTSQRSDTESKMNEVVERLELLGAALGVAVMRRNGYPGWQPDAQSPLLAYARRQFQAQFGREPRVTAIHAGLETGIIGAKKPGLQLLSFGPDIQGAHSPSERVGISSTARTWNYLKRILAGFGADGTGVNS